VVGESEDLMAEDIDILMFFIGSEVNKFRDARNTSAIISRSMEFCTRCDLPPDIAWLVAANFYADENERLREELKAASLRLGC
jgi:hypothetical protein